MDFFGGIRTEDSPRAIPKNRPLIFLAIGRATNNLVISAFLVSLVDGFLPVRESLPGISGFGVDFNRADAFPLSFPQGDACGENGSNQTPFIHSFFCRGGVRACLSTQTVGIIQTRAVSRELFHVELFRVQRFRT
jgi:hypothetical protein